jgi:hypothetical protein
MAVVLNLFGEGLRCWVCDIPLAQFQEMLAIKERHQLPWERLFFDFDFIKHYGFDHWSEMATRGEHRFFALKKNNSIELKEKRKMLFKIDADELDLNFTLFPIFQISVEENIRFPKLPGMKTILLVEQETGCFGKFEIQTTTFDINQLQFLTLHAIESYLYPALVAINYAGENLQLVSDDLVVRGTGVMLLHEEEAP